MVVDATQPRVEPRGAAPVRGRRARPAGRKGDTRPRLRWLRARTPCASRAPLPSVLAPLLPAPPGAAAAGGDAVRRVDADAPEAQVSAQGVEGPVAE